MSEVGPSTDLREQARTRLKKRQDFHTHVLVYLLVNAGLVITWAFTGSSFFWPMFPIAFWGVGVVMNGWDAYFASPITEEDIDREVARMRR